MYDGGEGDYWIHYTHISSYYPMADIILDGILLYWHKASSFGICKYAIRLIITDRVLSICHDVISFSHLVDKVNFFWKIIHKNIQRYIDWSIHV